jgi:asparagine synthase (glutamine-hydrolysing)
MCGIVGKLLFDPSARVGAEQVEEMLQPIAHRGPDGRGIHLDGNVGLGHCRLSIIDVGGGHQPMSNEDGTVWIVFNGEIYNFQPLREFLISKGHVFSTKSDTEVIVHLYEEFGTGCLERLRGMFAFAIWDKRNNRMFVARDRVGIKPLYYCTWPSGLSFASELKSIIADPGVARDFSAEAFRQFLSFNYLPGEDTLFKSVRRLLPGHFLVAEGGKVVTRQYWDLHFTRDRYSRTYEEVVEELYGLLGSTVHDHMIADVPVGVLLSGGVDSSAVLSFAVQGTEKRIKTFTVGFQGTHVVDERPYARMASEKFGTEHHEMTMGAEDFWDFLPSYVWHMEDPVCEPPAVALYYVSRLARDHVKVLLSGEGGDEAFAGYPNYPRMLGLKRIEALLGPLARPAGGAASVIGGLLGKDGLGRYGYGLGRDIGDHYFSRSSSPTAFFNRGASRFFTPGFLASTASGRPAAYIAKLLEGVHGGTLLDRLLYLDTKCWLPDDLLLKADKITMANSLELRVPLLDHKVLEFAASIPQDFKVRGNETKRALKSAFSRALPAEILNRKKVGFPVPFGDWLRGPLANRVSELLLSDRSVGRSYFERRAVEKLLRSHRETGSNSKEIFSLVVSELWFRRFLDAQPGSGDLGVPANQGPSLLPQVSPTGA